MQLTRREPAAPVPATVSAAAPVVAAPSDLDARTHTERVSGLAARITVAGEVLRVERAYGLDVGRLAQAEVWCRSAAQDLEQCPGIERAPAEARRILERVEVQLEAAEDALLEVDARVPSVAFDHMFGADRRARIDERGGAREIRLPIEITAELLSRYARFLAAHFDGSASRSQRIKRLVDRLLVSADGAQLVVRPWKDVRETLDYIVGDNTTGRTVTDAALAFFATAHARLAGVDLIEELFDGGFYLDLVGYQLSLGRAMLEPRILYASAVLDAAVSKKLAELVQLEGADLEEVKLRVFEVHAHAASAFDAGVREAPADISTRVASAGERRGRLGWIAPKVGALGRSVAVLVAVLLVAMSIGAMRRSTRDANELAKVAPAELSALSPALESGSFSRGESQVVFVGRVPAARWLATPHTERHAFAARLRRELGTRGVRAGLVYVDERVIVELLHGQILFVD